MNKEQKLNEVEQQLNRLFDDLKRKAFDNAQSAMWSGSVPDYMFEKDSHLLVMAVMDGVLIAEGQSWRRINDSAVRRDMRNIMRCI